MNINWPITRVYYDMEGHLVIVYASAWSIEFRENSDLACLEELKADIPRREDYPGDAR